MSIPGFSPFPPIPQRSTPEADFDAKMYALFQHFAVTHRNELLAFIDFLETNSTVVDAALNDTTIGLTTPAAAKFTDLEVLGAPGVLARFRDGVASNFLVQTGGNKTTIGNGAGSSRLALMAGNQEAIEFDSAGRASGAAVQASGTDTAPGKLVMVEGARAAALGHYGEYYPAGSNIDINAAGAGFVALVHDSNAGDWPQVPSGEAAHISTQAIYNGGSVMQTAVYGYENSTAPIAPKIYHRLRSRYENRWSPWTRLLHSENLLGSVSQSGGTPTGAVIERGSNANGEYVRFADGTQICVSPDWSEEVTTAAGALYRNASPITWTFPASFYSSNGLTGHVGVTGNSETHWGVMRTLSGGTDAQITMFGHSPFTNRTVRAMAIGRWF